MIGFEAGFEHHSGDSRTLEVTVVDENGDVVDISGGTITWALSKKAADSTTPKGSAIITKTDGSGIVIVDGPNGRCDVTIDPADTAALGAGAYYHELQLILGGETSTVLFGEVTILKDLIS